jgi:hypothetical protein
MSGRQLPVRPENRPRCDRATLARTMDRIAAELAEAAHSCAALQWAVSGLLDRAHHPDLKTELRLLQDIDRQQQILTDLAGLISLAAKATPMPECDAAELAHALRLASLRGRLFPGLEADADTGGFPGPGQDDVTWF